MSDLDKKLAATLSESDLAAFDSLAFCDTPDVVVDRRVLQRLVAAARVGRTGAEEVRREAMLEAARAVDALSDADAYATQSGALMDAAAAIRALATGERKETDDA